MFTSLAFPKMFAANKTSVVADNTATLLNAKLVLESERKEFLGNPEFGSVLISLLFKNGAPILKDIIIDSIYTTINNYIPQLKIKRENITIESDMTSVYAVVTVYNKSTNKNDLFSINLTKDN